MARARGMEVLSFRKKDNPLKYYRTKIKGLAPEVKDYEGDGPGWLKDHVDGSLLSLENLRDLSSEAVDDIFKVYQKKEKEMKNLKNMTIGSLGISSLLGGKELVDLFSGE